MLFGGGVACSCVVCSGVACCGCVGSGVGAGIGCCGGVGSCVASGVVISVVGVVGIRVVASDVGGRLVVVTGETIKKTPYGQKQINNIKRV